MFSVETPRRGVSTSFGIVLGSAQKTVQSRLRIPFGNCFWKKQYETIQRGDMPRTLKVQGTWNSGGDYAVGKVLANHI